MMGMPRQHLDDAYPQSASAMRATVSRLCRRCGIRNLAQLADLLLLRHITMHAVPLAEGA